MRWEPGIEAMKYLGFYIGAIALTIAVNRFEPLPEDVNVLVMSSLIAGLTVNIGRAISWLIERRDRRPSG